MGVLTIKSSFASGELAPSLWGRISLSAWQSGCSVARNFVVSYKGGLFSRAGTALVGVCKQAASASSYAPRNIEFSYNIFQSYVLEFGDLYMRVVANGGYVLEDSFAISAATRTDPAVIRAIGNDFAANDWVYIVNITGMTALNGRTFIVASVAGNNVTLNDIFGDPVDALQYEAYISGGTVARLFTLTTPWAAVDLPYLKFAQSKDVMTLCCVNQQTGDDYAFRELTRVSANDWSLAIPTIASSIAAPASCTVVTTPNWSTGAGPAAYGYVVTAIDATTGDESVASPIGFDTGGVDIAGQFGTNSVSWAAVTGADSYNIYRAAPDYTNVGDFAGQLFGFVGTSRTTTWKDTNIIADFNTTPPLAINPFPASGDFPGVVEYFQQRRGFGGTINDPDTYYWSQPGQPYRNFDSASPPIDSDAITGSPWAKQTNGIQWFLPMPGGCLVATGKDVWQISGTAGPGSPLTPAQQNAQQQESNGFSATMPPIKIGSQILYVQALGTIVREMNYSFDNNIYTGKDITLLSSHLFEGFNLVQWAWAQEPFKVAWLVRSDGRMLALTYVKREEIIGWTRHDTNGLFVSIATTSEPPTNAVYLIVKRYIVGNDTWIYCQERMDNRIWPNVEMAWCVDSGLSLTQPTPAATLVADRAEPTNGIVAGPMILGGSDYPADVSARIEDPTGSGAEVGTVTVAGGSITGYVMLEAGSGYINPVIVFTAATGTGAEAQVLIDKSVEFEADAAVFASGDVGSVIRMGGGVATITAFTDTTHVTADFVAPITATVPNDPNEMPLPAAAGDWTMTAPVGTVSGLEHLDGMTVTGLADGRVIPPTVVQNGMINLDPPASAVTVGLGFIAQAQSMHADIPGRMIQGKRKRIPSVTVRLANSRGLKLGQDQPIASALPNQAERPWNVFPNLLTDVEYPNNDPAAGVSLPLFTGDKFVVTAGDYQTIDGQPSPGMVAVLQDAPLPAEITAFIPNLDVGDVPD